MPKHPLQVIVWEPFLTVRIYPNPSDGMLMVEVKDIDSKVFFSVFDMFGRIWMQAELISGSDGTINQEINLKSLSKGIYIIKLNTGTAIKVIEVIMK